MLLEAQDRSRWDRRLIAEGEALLERAMVSVPGMVDQQVPGGPDGTVRPAPPERRC